MTQTHTSYEFSERLKEFLGDSAPEPMSLEYWGYDRYGIVKEVLTDDKDYGEKTYPAYQLHDLLSKPFCEAMTAKIGITGKPFTIVEMLLIDLANAHYKGGLPAVEKCLMDMMEGK